MTSQNCMYLLKQKDSIVYVDMEHETKKNFCKWLTTWQYHINSAEDTNVIFLETEFTDPSVILVTGADKEGG